MNDTQLPDDINEFYEISQKIFEILEALNDINSEYTINKLHSLYSNLQKTKTRSFTIGCFGLPFHLTESLTSKERKQLYKEITELITLRCQSNDDETELDMY